VTFGDGDFVAAFGLNGGGLGTLNSIVLKYPDGSEVVPRNKDLIEGVPRGTVYHQLAGGGGGFGDPKQRDRKKLAREVRNGVTSEAAAREIYGATDADLEVVE
jgi:N-methylhydantoinase B